MCGSIDDVADRRWFELFYDLVFVAALVNGCHLFQHEPTILPRRMAGRDPRRHARPLDSHCLACQPLPNRQLAARRTLVLIQMFSVAIAILAIGRSTESLSDKIGFLALGIAFLSIALMYAASDRAHYRGEARLVTWSSGLCRRHPHCGRPFAHPGAWIAGPVFAVGAVVGCLPVYWTLLGRLVDKRLDVERFSERLGELLVIVLGSHSSRW